MDIILKRKLCIFTITFLSVAVIAAGAFSWSQYLRSVKYERLLSASHERAFFELMTSVSEIDFALQKSLYCSSAPISGAICAEIYGKATAAQAAISALPCGAAELELTSLFINKAGDYAYFLSRSCASGSGFSDEQRENLRSLAGASSQLAQSFTDLYSKSGGGAVTNLSGGSGREGGAANDTDEEESLADSMRLIERKFPEIPSFIYDGPFYGYAPGASAPLPEGAAQISENEARRIAASFLGVNEGRVYISFQSGGDIPSYHLASGTEGGIVSIEVGKASGRILSLFSSRRSTGSEISTDDAKKIAARILAQNGYDNMVECYSAENDNVLTINYAYSQDGVVCYSDQVKLGIALDTGTISSFEGGGYASAHSSRDIAPPTVDAQTALSKIPNELEITAQGLALIPTEGGSELLCHEFKCSSAGGQNLIIYINAATGEQEQILLLIKGENGMAAI